MKKYLFLIPLILISSKVFCDVPTKKFVWEDSNGNVRTSFVVSGSKDTPDDVFKSLGNVPVKSIELKGDDEKLSQEDPKFLKLNGLKAEMDSAKKQADLDAKSAKEAEKQAVLTKLKISDAELQKIIK